MWYLLAPPYTEFQPSHERSGFPLGAILVHLDDGAVAGSGPAFVAPPPPWVALCVAVAPGESRMQDVGLAPHVAVATVPNPRRSAPAHVVEAIRHRAPPSRSAILDWIEGRVGTGRRYLAVASALGWTSDPVPERTTRSWLARHGDQSPRWWRHLANLARLRGRSEPTTAESLAERLGLSPRSLREWTRRHLGVPPHTVLSWPGWEWILVAGLRRAGAVNAWAVDPTNRPAEELRYRPRRPQSAVGRPTERQPRLVLGGT